MTVTVQRRVDGPGFEAGPKILTYLYAVSLDRAVPAALRSNHHPSFDCRNIIFDDGAVRIFRLAREGSFFEISFGRPGDPIPTLEITDVECPNG